MNVTERKETKRIGIDSTIKDLEDTKCLNEFEMKLLPIMSARKEVQDKTVTRCKQALTQDLCDALEDTKFLNEFVMELLQIVLRLKQFLAVNCGGPL